MAEAVRHDKTARQLRLLSDALDSGRLGPVRRLVNTLAPAEIGNLLESLPPGKREIVWRRDQGGCASRVCIRIFEQAGFELHSQNATNCLIQDGEVQLMSEAASVALRVGVGMLASGDGMPVWIVDSGSWRACHRSFRPARRRRPTGGGSCW